MQNSVYLLKKSPLFFLRPKLFIHSDNNGKIKGMIKILFIKQPLKTVKYKGNELFFQFYVDIICFDMIVKLNENSRLTGFIDTPIGDINFTGRRCR